MEDLRFAFEASQPLGISRKRLGQDLRCDVSVKLGVIPLPRGVTLETDNVEEDDRDR